MSKLPRPIGARVLVEELITSLSIRERGKLSGLTVITNDDEKPQCTMGRVIAVGADPFLVENGIEVGKVVFFDWYSGTNNYVEGKRYRTLEFQQITNVLDEAPEDARALSEVLSQREQP